MSDCLKPAGMTLERTSTTICFGGGLTPDAAASCRQEVDKEVPDDKRKGKMKTIQELEYRYEPEMEGA